MGAPPSDTTRGRQVYERYCTQCHGERGDGTGEVAAWTQPKPRDFRQGVFKFRSTPAGTLPTTADLDHTIRNGLYGTSMPPFDALNPRAVEDVIAYIQTRSPRWQKEQPGTPVVVATDPTPTTASVARGQILFAQNCASCHGDGTGNGPAATAMVDLWGNPVPPANLTLGRTKSARTARDVYLRVATGIDGTPMPGFSGALRPEEIRDVTHYVQALGPWQGSTRALRNFAAQLPPVVPAVTIGDSIAGTDSVTRAADTAAAARARTDTAPAPAAPAPTVTTPPGVAPPVPGADPRAQAAVKPGEPARAAAAGDTATPKPPPARPAPPPAARRTPATIVVRMLGDAQQGYRYEPANITARVGDVVRFVNVSGGPHNVAFWGDSIPRGAAATLQKNMASTMGPLSGALVTAPNAAYVISLAGLPAGTYRYYCLPHLALKMTGRITLRP